jgi:hypothetical protein
METQDYNGWTNRETWATMLHIDNDQVLLETAMEYAKQELDQAERDSSIAIYELAQVIQNWIEEDLLTRENIAGNEGLWLMLSDIGSLYRVNWREIAENLIDYVKENQEFNYIKEEANA